MVFPYYNSLSRQNKSIYRKSDKIELVPVRCAPQLFSSVDELQMSLKEGNRKRTEKLANHILNTLAEDVSTPAIKVKVLSTRPSNDSEELHGLYEPATDSGVSQITVWMRTAKHKKVVAFRSFLRTLLHELCHHLDYEFFQLEESFHTEGFFKREAHLFKQLMDE